MGKVEEGSMSQLIERVDLTVDYKDSVRLHGVGNARFRLWPDQGATSFLDIQARKENPYPHNLIITGYYGVTAGGEVTSVSHFLTINKGVLFLIEPAIEKAFKGFTILDKK
jgi:hypothetical protein